MRDDLAYEMMMLFVSFFYFFHFPDFELPVLNGLHSVYI